MVLELGRQQCDARVISQPGWSIGKVGDRRDDVGGLACKSGVPELFLVPGAPAVRRFDKLIADPPAAIAPFDHVNPASPIAAVGIIIAREEIAILVERQLLGVAKPRREDLELGAVRITAQHRSRIGHGKRPALGRCDVKAPVADTEIQPAIGPEPQAVQIMAQEADVNAVAVVQERSLFRPAVAIEIA